MFLPRFEPLFFQCANTFDVRGQPFTMFRAKPSSTFGRNLIGRVK